MTTTSIDLLERTAARFAAVHDDADPGTSVPSCPGWTMSDLIGHLTDIHRWATTQVTGADVPTPHSDADAVERYRDAAHGLVSALRAHGPAAACRTIYPPAIVSTWIRRQVHETTIHLWDATAATGREQRLPADLAADGVAEVTHDLYPRQVRLGRQEPLAASVAFRLDDADETVVLTGTDGRREALVTLSGSASDVLLVLWGRRRLDDVPHRVDGDATALRTALDATLVP